MASSTTKGRSGGSSSKSKSSSSKSSAKKSSPKRSRPKNPFQSIENLRDQIDKEAEKLYNQGAFLAADLLRNTRKQLDVDLPNVKAEAEKQQLEQALLQQDRDSREEATRKVRR